MLECGYEGDATGVYDSAVVVEDMDVGAEGEAFAAGYYAQRFGV